MTHRFQASLNPSKHGGRLGGSLAWLCVACAASVLWVGCDRQDDQVRTYKVPKEQASSPLAAAAEQPVAQRPAAAAKVMHWDSPDGWQVTMGHGGMRFATLTAGQGEDALEVSIIELSGAAGGVGPNVNRWRGQVGLDPVSDAEAAASATVIKARGAGGFLVDLTGPGGEREDRTPPRMLAAIFPADGSVWFIKATATAPVIEKHRGAFVALCNSVRFAGPAAAGRPTAPPAPSASAGRDMPRWSAVPDGWQADAKPRAMSVASITITAGSQQASLTITPLGGSQDLPGNINRWRRQVGLGPLANLDAQPPTPIEVAGQPGQLVDIVGSEKHILGVISTRGGMTWFYKLLGPDPLVAAQKAAFEAFVRSIEF